MFDRPRCRDWSPLSTQQLRLRSLIQISGHNIVLPELGPGERGRKCTVYYTLHQTPQSAPFYTSEKLDLHRNVLWAEIDCPATIKSSLRCVCVRVWMHRNEPRGGSSTAVHIRDDHNNACERSADEAGDDAVPSEVTIRTTQKTVEMDGKSGQDRVLFVWGVYFSGLVPLVRRSEKRLQPNTLVFQMHGGFFTSASCILEPEEQKKRPGLAEDTLNIPKTPAKFSSSGSTVTPTIPIDTARRAGRAGRGTADNVLHCDTSNNSSPLSPHPQYGSCSPPKNHWYFMNGGGMEKLSISPGDGTSRAGSDRASGEVVTGGALFQPIFGATATPTRWAEPTETNLKIRYLHMEFLTSEVLDSYDLEQLLAVQERQRRIRYEADSVKELIDRISMKSAYCLNLELFDSSKHMLVYRTVAEHQRRAGGMGKQLSRLLYQEREPIDPVALLRGQDLRRDIERARFRCRLLTQERDRISQGVLQHLRNKLNMLSDRNIERESALMERYRNYGKEKEQLYQQKMAYASQKDSVREVCGKVLMVRHRLLKELNGIYYIKPTNQGIYTINDVPLPNAESYTDSTPALALSVALGFVAHAVMMCSSFLDIPLRNPIKYDGSRSKIVDHIKLLPTMDREFPLHCRSGPAPNALLYGVYLLNQNISQLKHQLSLSRGDPRATLVNLQDILAIPGFGAGGGATLNRELEEPFQMLPTSAFGSSAGDLKMSPAFNSFPGVSSSGSSSSGSFLRESPSNSRFSRSVDIYTDRFQGQGRRQPMVQQRQVQFTPGQQARNCGSSGGSEISDQHQPPTQRRGCDSKFSSDPILTQGGHQATQRPFDFEGGKKF
ncbi:UV radiation resistance-associated gene protein [Anopheles ziemanni]|uniref:UV radiation resistance-associated gene protein n=1 Tax=Anopheles coustani TaxID=139045 RepID=UPI002657C983|nr:UV radiation resistance-associated gene protein [Anopheles coustani]XP_058172761.1 UV radiation resistance-associated gene protein [Anopheles ziemanni]